LTADEPVEETLRQYPSLTRQDSRAALAYAAWLAREEEEHPRTPTEQVSSGRV
jgi:uncharacterized protein (DUF433 family)